MVSDFYRTELMFPDTDQINFNISRESDLTLATSSIGKLNFT